MGKIKRDSFFANIDSGVQNLTFAILDAFAKDTDPNKVNLCIGGESLNYSIPNKKPRKLNFL